MEAATHQPEMRVIGPDGADVRPLRGDKGRGQPRPRLRVIRRSADLDREDNWTDLTGAKTGIEAAVASAADAGDQAVIEYEGFSVIDPGQPDDADYLSVLARGVAEHGEAFEYWSQLADTAHLEQFRDRYLGCCLQPEYMPEHLADALGVTEVLAQLRPDVRPFIGLHLSAWADHLLELGEVVGCPGADGLHLFLPPEPL
jgi:hypothetical protein